MSCLSSPWPLVAGEPHRLSCPICSRTATLSSTEVIWRSFSAEALYICPGYPACDTYVRCHAGSNTPLGTLAGPRLRRLRKEAHEAFDPLWNQPGTLYSRDFAYQAAGRFFGIADFHIGHLDEDGCRDLIARIDDLDEAIGADFTAQRPGPVEPDAITLDVLSELFRIGFDDQAMTIPAEHLQRLPSVFERATRSGLVLVVKDMAALSPFALTLLVNS